MDVIVATPNGTSAISSKDHFKYEAPTVTGVSPNTGSKTGGTSVTVTGSGFALGTTATTFKFGTVLAMSVDCISTTSCTVVAPAHKAGTVDLKATVATSSSKANPPADQFTYS
jgi:hypothetical protein